MGKRMTRDIVNHGEYLKALQVIETQAGLRTIAWSKGRAYGLSDASLRKLRAHKAKVVANLSMLCAWAQRVEPEGVMLYAARRLYIQTKAELEIVDASIEELSQILSLEVSEDDV